MGDKFGLHVCHPRSGDCAMRGLRFNLRSPGHFTYIGLFGGAVQRRRPDGTYADEWAWLSIEPRERQA